MVCLHYCVFLRCHTTTLPWFLLEKPCCVTFQTKLAAQETMKETIDSEVWFLDKSTTLQFHELNPNKLFSPLFNKNYRVCKAYDKHVTIVKYINIYTCKVIHNRRV